MEMRYYQCLRCNTAAAGWLASVRTLLLNFPRRWLVKRVATNIAVSQNVSRRLQLPRTQVIYHGVRDPLVAQKRRIRTELPSKGNVSFAYVGRLVSEKGLPLLLTAARRLKDMGYTFRVKFIGDGPERGPLESLADDLGLRGDVLFTGFLQGEALDLAVSDVIAVVMPTIKDPIFGLAAVEQMMCGRPVVVADSGGLAEVVGATGLKFSPGDEVGLVRCLKQVLDNPKLVSQLGRKARERALAVFSQERMVAEHLTVYRRLVGRRRP
jgi:glycosyltransferase involved in cell wall biosynthesis